MRTNNFKSERQQETKADAHKHYADKEARREYLREWKRKNRHREYMNKYNKEHPEKRKQYQRKTDLRRGYGMSLETYDALLAAQSGVCAICQEPCKTGRRLAVDHSHKTNRNRGLLCGLCNHALERIENDPDWGTKALNYLARYIEQTVQVK